MRHLHLVLCLALLVPAWALLGAFPTLYSGSPIWPGLTVGGLVGVCFGLVFDGNRTWRM
jgi:hypothetical protein